MATKTIPWNDGTGQSLYLSTDNGAAGTTTVTVRADKSASTAERSKTVTFSNESSTTTITVSQKGSTTVKTITSSTYNLMLMSDKTVTFVPNHDMQITAAILSYDFSNDTETYVAQFIVDAGQSYVINLPTGVYHISYANYTTSNIINVIVE